MCIMLMPDFVLLAEIQQNMNETTKLFHKSNQVLVKLFYLLLLFPTHY